MRSTSKGGNAAVRVMAPTPRPSGLNEPWFRRGKAAVPETVIACGPEPRSTATVSPMERPSMSSERRPMTISSARWGACPSMMAGKVVPTRSVSPTVGTCFPSMVTSP